MAITASPKASSVRLPRSKLEARKSKRMLGNSPLRLASAVDDLRLVGMQHQLADREAVGNHTPQCPRLPGAVAVTDDVVRLPLDWDARIGPHHPHVERLAQERVRAFDASTAVRFALTSLHRACRDHRPRVSTTLTTTTLTAAACRGLRSTPDRRTQRPSFISRTVPHRRYSGPPS